MSFSDRPSYGSWRYAISFLGCGLLLMGNLLAFATWYLTYWDLSTDTYRTLTVWDALFVIGLPVISFSAARICLSWATQDR